MAHSRRPTPAEIAAAIYEAVIDPSRWKEAGQAICEAAGASSFYIDSSHPDIRCVLPRTIHPEVEAGRKQVLEHFASKRSNPLLAAAMAQGVVAGTHRVRSQLVGDAEWHKSEYYNEVFRPSGFGDACLLAVQRHEELFDGGTTPEVHYSLFTLYRRPGMPPFGEAEQRLMEQLYPYLRRASELHRSLSSERGLAAAGMDALDRLTVGAFLLAPDGTVLHASAAAEEMVRLQDGLTLRKRHLGGMDERITLALNTVIARAAMDPTLELAPAGETLVLPRPSGKASWMITVLPLPRNDARRFDMVPAVALAIVADPESRVESPNDVLRVAFGLTPAEARVALALANGLAPNEVAEEHGTRLHTVRTQIKQLHDKLGVRNQGELIRRLVQGLGPIRHELPKAGD